MKQSLGSIVVDIVSFEVHARLATAIGPTQFVPIGLAARLQNCPGAHVGTTDAEHNRTVDDRMQMRRSFKEAAEFAAMTIVFVFRHQAVWHQNERSIKRVHGCRRRKFAS